MRGIRVGRPQLLASVIVAIVCAALVFALFAFPPTNAVPGSHSLLSVDSPNHSHLEQGSPTVASVLDADLNRHDSDGALSLFSDSAVVSDLANIACLPGPPPFCGGYSVFTSRVQIRGWLEQLVKEDIAVKENGSFRVTGDNVSWTLEISVDEYRRLDVAPLVANVQAVVQEGKIKSLTISLDQQSTRKLALGYAASQRTPYSILATGIGFGILVLGLVFPAAAVYYISRVKSLFATVPRLQRPWVLLQAGVVSLFIAIILVGVTSSVGVSIPSLDTIQYAVVVLTGFLILVAMVLMKRVWLVTPDE